MAQLTKAEAARQLGISRTTLYKLIEQGKVSPTPDGLIDTAELGRVVSTLNVQPERPRERTHTPLDSEPVDTDTTQSEHHGRPDREQGERSASAHGGRQLTLDTERQLTSTYRDMVDILREQLQAAQERERASREHIAQLTLMLDQAHQQNQRLLEAATRPSAPSAPAPLPRSHDAPDPSQGFASSAPPQDPVLTQILRWQDEGMTLRAIAAKLNAEGVPTRSGQGKWYQSNLSRELRRVGQGR